jgi:hypothetical protein
MLDPKFKRVAHGSVEEAGFESFVIVRDIDIIEGFAELLESGAVSAAPEKHRNGHIGTVGLLFWRSLIERSDQIDLAVGAASEAGTVFSLAIRAEQTSLQEN